VLNQRIDEDSKDEVVEHKHMVKRSADVGKCSTIVAMFFCK